tara:strand:- start:916 stop:1416 length:501 start_codon:yes stop_codon:yes gene_type:complete
VRVRVRARVRVRIRVKIEWCVVSGEGRSEMSRGHHLLVERHILHTLVEHGDDVLQPVARGELLRLERHPARLHRVHVRGARLRREEGEDARACADVEHPLPLEVLLVLVDGELVDRGAYVVLQHALLLHQRRVVVEVHLVLVRHPAQLSTSAAQHGTSEAEGPNLS